MPKSGFKILHKDKKTKARVGILNTPHGQVKTPSYVIVATYGQIRHLKPSDIKNTKTQLLICNTYHLWDLAPKKPGKKTFLTKRLGLKIPTMTDSGGFQVLSLAFDNKYKVGKFIGDNAKTDKDYIRSKIKIIDDGVYFYQDGTEKFLGPKLSMEIQKRLGADIVFAFDHITSPLDSHAYNKKALRLTDKWAKICLQNKNPDQLMFGIVQGGLFKDLRIQSAKSIGAMAFDPALNKDMRQWPQRNKSLLSAGFDGFGLGGSYTKKQISKVLKWMIPYLPEEKPRHLLGVGKIEDVFEAVENGVDTFDCVIPTREARHGRLWTKDGKIDIRRGVFKTDEKIIEKSCKCPTCHPTSLKLRRTKEKITRAEINRLIKSQDENQKAKGQRYALLHNIWFFNHVLEQIRDSIEKNKFSEFKKGFLSRFQS